MAITFLLFLRIIKSCWWNDPSIRKQHLSLVFLVLKYASDVIIVTPASFDSWVHGISTLLFLASMSLCFMRILCREHRVGSCFFIQLTISVFYIGVFRTFVFNLIINIVVFKFILLIFVFHLSHLLFVFFFFPLPSLNEFIFLMILFLSPLLLY